MFLTTTQIRKLGNEIAGFGAQYTEKTKTDKTDARRSVVWRHFNKADADSMFEQLTEQLKKMGVENTVTRTSVSTDMIARRMGGEYIRVIAQIG